MTVKTLSIDLQTEGRGDILDITRQVAGAVSDAWLRSGTVTVFCPSATSALTTLEYESGCISDLQRLFDEIVDPARHYARWGDGNGLGRLSG